MREPDLEAAVEALHRALLEIESHRDPAVRATLGRVLDGLRRVHEEGIRRLAELALSNPETAREALSHPVVANLLHLYGVTGEGDGSEVVEVVEGTDNFLVRLASGDTVSFVPEEKLRRLERRLSVAPATAPPGEEPLRIRVASVEELASNPMIGRLPEGHPVLLVRTGGGDPPGSAPLEVWAFRNACPGSLLPLHLGELQEGQILCPWHGCGFDASTGRRTRGEGPGLERLAVEVREGEIEVEIP